MKPQWLKPTSLSVTFALALATASRLSAANGSDFARLDAYLEAQLREARIPGAAIVVVSREGVMHMRGFGVGGPDVRPVSSESLFILGSVSKSFTALAVMQLVEEGKLELDASVQRYLPWFQSGDPAAASFVTVRRLLTHTSGYSTAAGRQNFADEDDADDALERLARRLGATKLTVSSAPRFQYSNANYVLLGALIERVAGKSYEEYMAERVLGPLGMTRTLGALKESGPRAVSTGYRYWFGMPVTAANLPHPRAMKPAGYLISNAEEMGRYLQAHLSDGTLDGRRVLSAAGVEALHHGSAPAGRTARYGMGWMADTARPGFSWHDGSVPNFHSYIAISREKGWGFGLLVNADNYLSGPNIYAFGERVALLLDGGVPAPLEKGSALRMPLLIGSGLFAAQVAAIGWTLVKVRRRRPEIAGACAPSAWRFWLRFLLPTVVSAALAAGLFLGFPRLTGLPLSGTMLFAPDLGCLVMINGVLAAAWCVGRPWLLLRNSHVRKS